MIALFLSLTSYTGRATMRKLALIGATVVGAAVLSTSPISINWSAEKTITTSQAFAEVGKPLSAGSVAGVHRRQDRRDTRHGTTTNNK
jgi:hypothetical protein